MVDLILAIAHHVLVFGLTVMLAMELAQVRPGLTASAVNRLAGLDIGYGATAGLIIVIGIHRVIFGAKGSVFYVENAWFWAKMATFAAIGIISIAPTLRFRAWKKALARDPAALPAPADIARVRSMVRLQMLLIFAVVAFAATMARYAGN
jgi:putative membrane protein